MLSFDISDRQVNIVKGDNSTGKIKIDRSLSVDIPEGVITEGEVINLTKLGEMLTTALKQNQMMDKEAVVTFSSGRVVFKELIVPNAKGNEFLAMVQNQMQQEMGITDDYSISYTKVGNAGADNPGSVKVLATACPSKIVECFRKLFTMMNIALKSVNISCNSVSRIVLADKSNLDKMPLLVCQVDPNFLGLILFENGQMAFARYEPVSPEDYESDEYLTEAISENIFRMEQFNKARGGTGLSNVILYGRIDDYMKLVDALDSFDVKASILNVPSGQVTGYENFEFSVYANAIGALYKRNKETERINLLEVDNATGKNTGGTDSAFVATLVGSVAVSVAIIAVVTGIFKLSERSIQKDIDKLDDQIAECDKIIAANQKLHDYLIMANEYTDYVKEAREDLETLPIIKKQIFTKIEDKLKMGKDDIKYEGFKYDRKAGTVVLTKVQLPEQQSAQDFVKTLVKQGYFADVTYNGYTGTGKDNNPVIISQLTLTIKDVPKEDSAAEETKEAE